MQEIYSHHRASQPAEIIDYDLQFKGAMGMAFAIPIAGASFHGVIHLMTDDEFIELDKVESGYGRNKAKAKLYDGTIVDVSVYTQDEKKMEEQRKNPNFKEFSDPSERYISIMIEGMENHGVNPEYIEKIRNRPCVKSKTLDELEKFDVPEGAPEMTM